MELPPRSGRPTGPEAELAARRFLEAQDFRLVAANYRSRHGEVDLVVRKGALLVFVEVRLRSSGNFGGAAASVTSRKQQKIIATAGAFLHHHPEFTHCNCRFDVIALHGRSQDWQIEWIPAAFTT